MTTPDRVKRKNPVLPTRKPTLPPINRSRIALGLTSAAAQGRFKLQVCRSCDMVQYPPREACQNCLCDELVWSNISGDGELLAATTMRRPYELYHRTHLQWKTGLVRLDCGVNIVAFLHGDCSDAPAKVRVRAQLDRSGNAVLVALPAKETSTMKNDPLLRALGCSPQGRKALVTDGTSPLGQAMVDTLISAGADLVWVGVCEPWKASPGLEELKRKTQATILPLDLTNTKSVRDLAGQIGGRIDILINTAEFHRSQAPLSPLGVETARVEMETNYFGLLRLAQSFAPAMSARAADGDSNAVAWVNILSVYALANYPAHGTFSASKAAAFSLAQGLRAELRATGLRVLNVFPGPVDDDWSQQELPPKIAVDKLANLTIGALEQGIEDLYPDPIARDWHARWRDDPKILESELSQSGMVG